MIPTVLIGSPGSGKGTQGKLLSAYFGVPTSPREKCFVTTSSVAP